MSAASAARLNADQSTALSARSWRLMRVTGMTWFSMRRSAFDDHLSLVVTNRRRVKRISPSLPANVLPDAARKLSMSRR